MKHLDQDDGDHPDDADAAEYCACGKENLTFSFAVGSVNGEYHSKAGCKEWVDDGVQQ